MVTETSPDSRERDRRAAVNRASWRNGVSARIVTLMSLALLPLGLIAVLQTQRSTQAAIETYRVTLVAQTSSAAQPERERILSAFAVARTLANTISALQPEPAACERLMRQTAQASADMFEFVGFIGLGAISNCNNLGEVFDFSQNANSQKSFADPQPHVLFNPSGDATGLPVVIVSQPIYLQGAEFAGFISLSFTAQVLEAQRAQGLPDTALELISFNTDGEILTSDVSRDNVEDVLPVDVDLPGLVGSGERVFSGQTHDGRLRDFAVAPIVDGEVYALGSWSPALTGLQVNPLSMTSLMFPFLMWLVTLAIAVVALRRQVVRPIKTLQLRMRSFADGRRILRGNSIDAAPGELREIGAAFEAMADQIVRDEAELEDQLYERDLLTLEVHHRVKNNLQLMSSIVNMQIRQAQEAEAKNALRGVQSRLASLAKFHQDLYETPSLSTLRADQLLDELARQMMSMRTDALEPIDLRLELDAVSLTPDQASPLAMLATEALTNALKYAGAALDGGAFIRLSLKCTEDGDAVMFEIENSLAEPVSEETPPGLGTRLMAAFGSQLEAEIERTQTAHGYLLCVTFALRAEESCKEGTDQRHPAL